MVRQISQWYQRPRKLPIWLSSYRQTGRPIDEDWADAAIICVCVVTYWSSKYLQMDYRWCSLSLDGRRIKVERLETRKLVERFGLLYLWHNNGQNYHRHYFGCYGGLFLGVLWNERAACRWSSIINYSLEWNYRLLHRVPFRLSFFRHCGCRWAICRLTLADGKKSFWDWRLHVAIKRNLK